MFNSNLQPGATGPEVQKLQEYLVSGGYMTQDQMNTGPGIYGPRTTAAVKALQAKLGVDNSSGPGYFGPKTRAAIGAGTPAPTTPDPTLPPTGGTPPVDPTLPPTPGGETSPLLSFANSVDAAVNLARTHRNASSVDMMKPFQGTLQASDFNSILGNINAASDKTSEDLIKRAGVSADPTNVAIVTNDNGDVSGIDRATGTVVWTAPGVGNKDTNATGTAKDRGNDIAAAILDFQNKMKSNGWRGANPDAYEYYKAQLIKAYGASAALDLDKAMESAKIYVDNGTDKPFGPAGGSFSMADPNLSPSPTGNLAAVEVADQKKNILTSLSKRMDDIKNGLGKTFLASIKGGGGPAAALFGPQIFGPPTSELRETMTLLEDPAIQSVLAEGEALFPGYAAIATAVLEADLAKPEPPIMPDAALSPFYVANHSKFSSLRAQSMLVRKKDLSGQANPVRDTTLQGLKEMLSVLKGSGNGPGVKDALSAYSNTFSSASYTPQQKTQAESTFRKAMDAEAQRQLQGMSKAAVGTVKESPKPPSVNLSRGAEGNDVKKLQDYLVDRGYMTEAEKNTGYGTYGPKTAAAVRKLQTGLGIANENASFDAATRKALNM